MKTADNRQLVEQRFEDVFERLSMAEGNLLSPIGAGLLAASYCNYCSDSHSFSKRLGIEHALVIRECVHLSDQVGAIELEGRNPRSQGRSFTLTSKGLSIIEAAL